MFAMSRLLLAVLSLPLAASASAQCNIIDQDFNQFSPGLPIDSLVGWRDQAPSQTVFLGTSPDNLTTAIVFGLGSGIARRRIDNLGLGQRFQIASDVRIDRDGAFRLQCAPVFTGGNVQMNYRVNINFDQSAPTPVIRYNYFGSNTTATLPLQVGVPTRLQIDVDTQGDVATYYNGMLLAIEPWATGGPFACATPQDAVWLSYASGSGAGMVVDDVCIGDPFATNYCTAAPNSTGVISKISALGTPSVSANDMFLSTNDLPNASFGFYVIGMTQGFVANPAGSSGNLCLSGSIGRNFPASGSGNNGNITVAMDWARGIAQPSGFVAAMAGDTWNFQLWHRDVVAGSATSNFSEGLTVTLTP